MTTILVVEDEPSIADLLAVLLEAEGYRVMVAGNGREALERIAVSRPDLVLSDVMMPGMDGRELCRRLERQPNHSRIPVVLMSAVSHPKTLTDCHAAAFVEKPFDIDKLLATVRQVLKHPARPAS